MENIGNINEDVRGKPDSPEFPEEVWRYRGYSLRSGEFTTAMVHYFRAEIQRSNTWRSRLDVTTNWAVVSAGAGLSYSLASPDNHYSLIVLVILLISLFLWIEARRYRYYELWSSRARLLETDFFAAMLVPPFKPNPGWGESLAESLLQPEFPISVWEALGRRLRRNYLFIFLIMDFAWILKLLIHPVQAQTWTELVTRAGLGPIPGWAIIVAGLIFNAVMFLLASLTVGLHNSTGEVLPKYNGSQVLNRLLDFMEMSRVSPARIRSVLTGRQKKQFMTFIITDQPDQVSARVMKEMHLGVTSINGQGMYTHKDHSILLIALTITQVSQLKALVTQTDPNAFMIVSPAQEILSRGVKPLSPRKESYQTM